MKKRRTVMLNMSHLVGGGYHTGVYDVTILLNTPTKTKDGDNNN